ncbi:MAG: Dam family site-specific DNA-(adenine-N6)-methyltransferase [Oscillospiraceae bacterium]|nr:Dam family site-specific DNA-(adenine-N6)-methyltransferase [Oscillospiraceae bacterium]
MVVSHSLMRPLLGYTGSKYKLLKSLFKFFPDNVETFVDLCCGGCSVGLNVWADRVIMNDKDLDLIGMYSSFKEQGYEKIIELIEYYLEYYNFSRTEIYGHSAYGQEWRKGVPGVNKIAYDKMREDFNAVIPEERTFEDFVKFYLLTVYSFGGQIRWAGHRRFSESVGKADFTSANKDKLKRFLDRLSGIDCEFKGGRFTEFNFGALTQNDFVYVDPPYLITNASYVLYNDGWNENDERELLKCLDMLNDRGIKFGLSNVLRYGEKENMLLKEWIKSGDFRVERLEMEYGGALRNNKKSKEDIEEVLIMNYR